MKGDKTILLTFYLGYLELDEEVSYNLGSRLYLDIRTDALSDVFSTALSYNYWLITSSLEKELAAYRDEKYGTSDNDATLGIGFLEKSS